MLLLANVVLILPSVCTAQIDSLGDCFPLSIGNRWLYRYDRLQYHANDPVGAFIETDSGTTLCKITGKTEFPDSVSWAFQEWRIFHRLAINYIFLPTIDTLVDSTIIDSTMFQVIELKSGRHELFRQESQDLSSLFNYYSGVLWNSTIPYQRGVPDSVRVYRYHSVDSTSTATFYFPSYLSEQLRVTAQKQIGFASISIGEWCVPACGMDVRYQLLSQVIAEVHGDHLGNIPLKFSLSQNYPNPFNPSTEVRFEIPPSKADNNVSLIVFDILGREVVTLVNERKHAGAYALSWDARMLPSGVYFYRLSSGPFVSVKKMVLLR